MRSIKQLICPYSIPLMSLEGGVAQMGRGGNLMSYFPIFGRESLALELL